MKKNSESLTLYLTCKKCGQEKSYTEFYKDKSYVKTGGYRDTQCKLCKKKLRKDNYTKIKESKQKSHNDSKIAKEAQDLVYLLHNFTIESHDFDGYIKFDEFISSISSRVQYLCDSSRSDTLTIQIRTKEPINDVIEFQMKGLITNIISSYLNNHTALYNVFPNDIDCKTAPPDVLIFTYKNKDYTFQEHDSTLIKNNIHNENNDMIVNIL